MTRGLELDNFDHNIALTEDLFRHVNGTWLRDTDIPADRSTAGSFVTLVDEAEEAVRQIIEECQAHPADEEQRKIGELYASFMDADRIEALGTEPVTADLQRIEAVATIDAFIGALGSLERSGVASLIGMYIAPDRGQPDRYVTHLVQSGIGLPDESYYREEQFAPVVEAYRSHIERMLTLVGVTEAEAKAARVVALETEIAAQHWDRVACRDAQKTYNLMPRSDFAALSPRFDWANWALAADVREEVLAEAIVAQPSFLEGIDELLVEDRLEDWKSWLAWHLVTASASYLTEEIVQASFDFYGRTLQGTDEIRPRWKRAVGFVEGAMGEAVGKAYVAKHYPASSRERMNELVDNLLAAYRDSITRLDWMSDQTKQRALDKLGLFTAKVGHRKNFKDYSALTTDPGDLIGNARRAMGVSMERELAKIGQPIDKDEWYMTPQTVNAYYSQTTNEIVFPAAILQPPFFDADADDAINYGGIGAVIGHEIGHGFDDQGSQFDGTGQLENWWDESDRTAFEERTAALIAQYAQLSPTGAEGQCVNGELTIGENIGDLGGLGIAYKAFKLAGADQGESIDGYTPTQRFFLSWAQVWCGKVRPTETVRRLTVDPHSPPEFRCNQVARNMDAFHEAFGVQPGDAMWLAPEDRVSIW